MKALNFEQIKTLVHGAARVEEGDGKISFFRFTEEQQELYKSVYTDFYNKSFSTSGIYLEFDTDSENLAFSVEVTPASSRRYFTHSIFKDGVRIGELSGDIGSAEKVNQSKEFKLGKGKKRIRILFPWSVASRLTSLCLDDNASFSGTQKDFKMLVIGDSITQGYDASRPEIAYSLQITDHFNAEALNKGIAGEQFFGRFASIKEEFEPDLITVAYGTNDWRHGSFERFTRECRAFFENLRKNYPDVLIIAITPLWRVDIDNPQVIGKPLSFIADYIRDIAKTVPKMKVIEGFDLIPHNAEHFQTDGVHPVDSGFMHYGKNLLKELTEII